MHNLRKDCRCEMIAYYFAFSLVHGFLRLVVRYQVFVNYADRLAVGKSYVTQLLNAVKMAIMPIIQRKSVISNIA